MKKTKTTKFSMIELLVGMAVLSIMMTFLISAFISAEHLASNGNSSMEIFERSTAVLDYMSRDIRQLSVSDKAKITYEYSDSSIDFKGRLLNSDTPYDIKRIKYAFDKSTNEVSREVFSYDAASKKWDASEGKDILLDEVAELEFIFLDADLSTIPAGAATSLFPDSCRISFKLQQSGESNEDMRRVFDRRISFEK